MTKDEELELLVDFAQTCISTALNMNESFETQYQTVAPVDKLEEEIRRTNLSVFHVFCQ